MTTPTNRVFSGIQPSGDIHIGNYLGAVKKWVELTETHDCIYCVVDNHAITVEYDVKQLPQRTFNGVLATMACGLDPDKCTIFVQSHVKEHTELAWLFNSVTPMGSLFRMTQFKDKARNALQRALATTKGSAAKNALFDLKKMGSATCGMSAALEADLSRVDPRAKRNAAERLALQSLVMRINDTMGKMMQQLQVGLGVAEASVGLFDYPVLQAADILLYKATLVPVGEDQEQHLELCREVAERFNRRFGDVFPKVARIKGEAPRIMGLDGVQKMSKSLNNYIGVLDSKEEIEHRLKPAFTDPKRLRRNDPGRPDVCNVFNLHGLFDNGEGTSEIRSGCEQGSLGCLECKMNLAARMDGALAPIRERARQLRANPNRVIEALDAGRKRAAGLAAETMEEVRSAMGIGPNVLKRL